jgi:hypothetical protein
LRYGHKLPGQNQDLKPISYDFPQYKPGSGNPGTPLSDMDRVFGFFNALGTIAFAYAGHNVVLEIQATLPSTPDRPSKVEMWRGVMVAYGIVAAGYFPVALIGYWAYGNQVTDDVITFVSHPTWLVFIANIMVVIHVIGSYQVMYFNNS